MRLLLFFCIGMCTIYQASSILPFYPFLHIGWQRRVYTIFQPKPADWLKIKDKFLSYEDYRNLRGACWPQTPERYLVAYFFTFMLAYQTWRTCIPILTIWNFVVIRTVLLHHFFGSVQYNYFYPCRSFEDKPLLRCDSTIRHDDMSISFS